MADEADNIILEHLRLIRSDIGRLDERVTGLGTRLDGIEHEVRGLTYAFTMSLGSMLADLRDLKDRVAGIERI